MKEFPFTALSVEGLLPGEIGDLFALIQELDHTDSNFYKLLFRNNNIIAK
jgi:hypothetical protein